MKSFILTFILFGAAASTQAAGMSLTAAQAERLEALKTVIDITSATRCVVVSNQGEEPTQASCEVANGMPITHLNMVETVEKRDGSSVKIEVIHNLPQKGTFFDEITFKNGEVESFTSQQI